MLNRWRVELYDANKLNDLTIYSDVFINRDDLTYLAYTNIKNFHGMVRGYIYDNVKKKKVSTMFLDESIVTYAKSRTPVDTAMELGLA